MHSSLHSSHGAPKVCKDAGVDLPPETSRASRLRGAAVFGHEPEMGGGRATPGCRALGHRGGSREVGRSESCLWTPGRRG